MPTQASNPRLAGRVPRQALPLTRASLALDRVRQDLIVVLNKLAKRIASGKLKLDGIIIETTGMADPAPVAQTFFVDDQVKAFARLDGIVTLVCRRQHLTLSPSLTLTLTPTLTLTLTATRSTPSTSSSTSTRRSPRAPRTRRSSRWRLPTACCSTRPTW